MISLKTLGYIYIRQSISVLPFPFSLTLYQIVQNAHPPQYHTKLYQLSTFISTRRDCSRRPHDYTLTCSSERNCKVVKPGVLVVQSYGVLRIRHLGQRYAANPDG